ncbi:MAG: hypothetical protein V3U83_07955 [Acidobacteriota bacterium]
MTASAVGAGSGGEPPARTGSTVIQKAIVLIPALLAPIAVLLGYWTGGRFLLPILATLAVYPILAILVRREKHSLAVIASLLWAFSLSGTVITVTAHDPEGAAEVVLNGPTYRDEMFDYIRTGHGRETDPGLYLPQHLIHLGAFILLTVLSGGLFGIALGAVLVGYMSYYVGALAAAGSEPWLAFMFGWPPWAILRVAAYIMLGVTLARPLLSAIGRHPIPVPPAAGTWYITCAALLLLDVILKGLLAPHWAVLLRPCLGA